MFPSATSTPKKNLYNYNTKELNGKFLKAVVKNDIDKVKKYLLICEANEIKNSDGDTAAFLAMSKGYYKLFHLLVQFNEVELNPDNGPDMSLMAAACIRDDITALKILINNGANINCTLVNGETPLHCSALNNSPKTCQYLLDFKHININAKEYTYNFTSLHCACKVSADLKIIQMLCNHKDINLNAIDCYGDTALCLACCNPKNISIVKCLIGNVDCDINLCNSKNLSPLDIACSHKSDEIIKLLIGHNQLNTKISNSFTNNYLEIFCDKL